MKRRMVPIVLSLVVLLGGVTLLGAQQVLPVIPASEQPGATQQTQTLLPLAALEDLVAPIALYPDPLLSQMLIASTYPLEIVEASQWLTHNQNLKGQALMDAVKQQPWDASVQALVAVPDALAILSQDISWTTSLGNAFLAQQNDVMNAVQQMRARAQSNGVLASTPQQTVTTEDQGGQDVIVIEPASPQIIYVPAYDPYFVWGAPAYGYYPPLYYSAIGFGFGPGFNLGLSFSDWGGWNYWGWGPDWFGGTVFVNNAFFPRFGFRHGYIPDPARRTIWAHNPAHRLGIPYSNPEVAERFHGHFTSPPSHPARPRPGNDSRAAMMPHENGFAGRAGDRGRDALPPQTQRFQDQRPGFQAPPQKSQVPQERFQAPRERSQVPQERFQAPRERSQVPQERFQAPQSFRVPSQPRFQAPVERFQAPQPRFQAPRQFSPAVPHMSQPHFGGNMAGSGGRPRR